DRVYAPAADGDDAAIGQYVIAAASRVREWVRNVREGVRCRIPLDSCVALAAIAPAQDVAVRQQLSVHRDDGPVEQAAPLASRTGATSLIRASGAGARLWWRGHVDRDVRPRFLQVASVVDGPDFDRRCVAAVSNPRITPGYGSPTCRHFGHWMPGRTA